MVGPDLNPNCLILLIVDLEELFEKVDYEKSADDKKRAKLPRRQIWISRKKSVSKPDLGCNSFYNLFSDYLKTIDH